MNWVAGILLAFALLISGLQVVMRIKARRMRGTILPPIPPRFGANLEKGSPRVFYFHSPGCRACRMMTPMVEGIAAENDNLFVVDASAERETAAVFGIMGTPSTIRVKDGRITDFLLGPQSKEVILGLTQRGNPS